MPLELLGALQKEFSIDPQRIYVTGLSMGGFGTWDLVARRPDLFAAAVPVCGGGDEATATKIAKLPVWVFHGAKDGVVKPARSDSMVKALEKVDVMEYDNITEEEANDIMLDHGGIKPLDRHEVVLIIGL